MDTAGGTGNWCTNNGGNDCSAMDASSKGRPREPCATWPSSMSHVSSGSDDALRSVSLEPSAAATMLTDHAMYDGVDGDSDVGTGTNEDDMECNALGTEAMDTLMKYGRDRGSLVLLRTLRRTALTR